jgi:hypothetical protein
MRWLHFVLATALLAGMACGGENGATAPSQTPGATSATPGATSASATPGASPPPSATPATPVATPGASASAAPAAVPHVEMRAPVASTLGADVRALGIDPQNLPPMEKLDPKALRGSMKLLARSLGARCIDCHTEGDFAATTRRKKIAAKMWDEFAAKLTSPDGSPVFCDSCHQGRIVLLDRGDKKALAKWMDASFVDGLKRKDGKAEECESCHVDMEMRFLTLWGK